MSYEKTITWLQEHVGQTPVSLLVCYVAAAFGFLTFRASRHECALRRGERKARRLQAGQVELTEMDRRADEPLSGWGRVLVLLLGFVRPQMLQLANRYEAEGYLQKAFECRMNIGMSLLFWVFLIALIAYLFLGK